VQQSITISDVGGIGGKYNLYLSKEEDLFLPLPEEINLQFHYALLDGKHIDNSLFKGSLVRLSPKGAEIRPDNIEGNAIPERLSNIKLNLLIPGTPTKLSEDIYGKVLKNSADDGTFYIHFTSKPPEVQAMLDALYKSIKD
jgi:adenylate cyclase